MKPIIKKSVVILSGFGVVLGLGFFVGGRIGWLYSTPDRAREISTTGALPSPTGKTAATSGVVLSPSPASAVPASTAAAKSAAVRVPRDDSQARAEVNRVIDKLHLQDVHQELAVFFPPTPIGQDLLALASFADRRDALQAEGSVYRELLERIQSEPDVALAAGRTALSQLPEQYTDARQLIMQTLARSGAKKDDVVDFLKEQMAATVSTGDGTGGSGATTPAVAIDMLVVVEREPAAIDAAVRAGIAAQPSSEARHLMLATYGIYSPDSSQKLRQELNL